MVLPNGWKRLPIEDFAEVVTGGTPDTSRPDYWLDGTVPWLNSGELNRGVITTSVTFITDAGLQNSSAKMMPEDTVLVALTGATTGTAAILKMKACANQSVTGILPSSSHLPSYVLHYLRHIRPRIVADSWGGAQKHISQGYIKKLLVPLPPLPEQRRIGAILDKADDLRAKRRAGVDQLNDLTQSMFSDLLCVNAARTSTVSVEDAMEEIIDYRGKTPAKTEGGVPLVTARVVHGGDLLEPNEFIAEADYDGWMRRGLPKPGDVLFTTEAPLGEVAQLDERKVALAQRLLVLRGKPALLNNTYLKFALTAPEVRQQIEARATGSTVRGIRQSELRKVLIPVPPLDRQQEFAGHVEAIERIRTCARKSVIELDTLFASLQQQAFAGAL